MQEAITKKKTFYQFFRLRRPFRDWHYTDRYEYCPICDKVQRLVVVGLLNNHYTGEEYERCQDCLLKLPSLYAEKLIRFRARNKIDKNQTRL